MASNLLRLLIYLAEYHFHYIIKNFFIEPRTPQNKYNLARNNSY